LLVERILLASSREYRIYIPPREMRIANEKGVELIIGKIVD